MPHLRIKHEGFGTETENPSYEGTLAHILVSRLAVDVDEYAELVDTKEVENRQRDGADQRLLVNTVDGG